MSIKKTDPVTVADDTGAEIALISPEDAAVIANAATDLINAAGSPSFRVLALQAFGAAKPPRSYNVGDEVIGWSRERAEHYAKQGLVEVIEG